jgi:lipopolysaccharide transport system ATP-binding protein
MSNIAIKFENISKQYRLGTIGTGTLSHDLNRWYARVRGKEDPNLKIGQTNILSSANVQLALDNNLQTSSTTSSFIWALKDINLEVSQGEVLGIIGKNGAGKSTLLKILSRVTTPTTGIIKAKGRIASLLEVGTGFHPEMTGRENIFMNGSIMGMKSAEIKNKFDEIVDFAGIDTYIDTPVKRYSSGMTVRLGFAIAAHLKPDILIVDEVLAVGDLLFQRKCIDKMINISKEGKTILFVSHNLSAVKSLCNNGILIKDGHIFNNKNKIDAIIEEYTKYDFGNKGEKEIDLLSSSRKESSAGIRFDKLYFNEIPIKFGNDIEIGIKLKSLVSKTYNEVELGIAINDKFQTCLIHVGNRFVNKIYSHSNDNLIYNFSIENSLKPGHYQITLFLRTQDTIQDWLTNIASFEILSGNPYGYLDSSQIQGVILPKFSIYTSNSKNEEKN